MSGAPFGSHVTVRPSSRLSAPQGNQRDSRILCQWNLDSGFKALLEFRISQAKLSWILNPDSLT